MRYKRIFLIALGVFASGLITLHSLSTASQKNFWIDEVYELITPLDTPQAQIWSHGVRGSPSVAPLYFSLQRLVIPPLLKKERDSGRGYDWRISLRLVPALSLAAGAFAAFLILLDVQWLLALGLPIFLGSYNFALYYGAETRIYATWLGLALAFYAATLRFIVEPKLWPWGFGWCFLGVLLSLTSISSPILIGPAILVIVGVRFFSGTKKPFMWIPLALSVVLTAFLFFQYKVMQTHFSWALVQERSTWDFFKTEGLRMLEGPRKALELIGVIVVLIFGGIFGTRLPSRRLILAGGALCFSQVVAAIFVFILQCGTGYWFAPRHGIFLVAVQAMASSCFVVLCLESLNVLAKHLAARRVISLRHASACIGTVVVFVAFLNWRAKKPNILQKMSSKISIL